MAGRRRTSVRACICIRSTAAQRIGADETAFGHRDKNFAPVIVGVWSDPADNAANTQ
jgi:hypothetical protein